MKEVKALRTKVLAVEEITCACGRLQDHMLLLLENVSKDDLQPGDVIRTPLDPDHEPLSV